MKQACCIGLILLLQACSTSDPENSVSASKANERSVYSKHEENILTFLNSEYETTVWASLVELSTWADSLKKNEYTLLVPSDAVLRGKGLDKYQALVPSANRTALNQEIGHHLISGRISFANLPDTVLKNVNGESLIYSSSTKKLSELEITAVERDLKLGRVIRIR
ncbi:MAG: hypothetical protein RLZZ91_1327 [Bacteroidota bacterium]|jgi:uncharacterized surface protein with fasciclin (FAS1) repeats